MMLAQQNIDPIITDREFLCQRSRDITKEELSDLKLHERLQRSLKTSWTRGTGLSAIQIGIPIRFGWYQLDKPGSLVDKFSPVFLINPEIIKAEDPQGSMHEGCLSIPDQRFQTWRFTKITYLSGIGSDRKPFEVSGFEAIVVQHEVDHMNGILCTERIQKPDEPGRNEPCPCGSGKKFKKCCNGAGESS